MRGGKTLKLGLQIGLAGALLALSLSGQAAAQTASDYTTYYRYDGLRRVTMKIGPDPDGSGGRPRAAEAYHYNTDGQIDQAQVGTTTQIDGSDFVAVQITTSVYDAVGNKIRQTTPAGVTEFSYDAADRPTCTAIRMDPNVYGSLPDLPNACSAWGANKGPYGPDQITNNVYDAAGQLKEVWRGLDTSLAQAWSRTTYTANGKVLTTTDANANTSTYGYDGFDRLIRLDFPSKTQGANASNTGDHEDYDYDKNGLANTGGGGGGSGYGVVVRYPTVTATATATGGTVTTSGGYTIHRFTANGTLVVQ